MNFRVACCALSAVLVAGCANQLTLIPRDDGPIGRGTAPAQLGYSGDLTIEMGERTYVGEWTMMAGDTMVGTSFGTANATAWGSGGYASGTATGSSLSVLQNTQGSGQAFAEAADGHRLRCRFDYNEWSSTGVGVCVDSDERVYDLTIR